VIDIRYLIDTNVLGKLSVSQRAGRTFRSPCRIPAEALVEASGYPDFEQLRALVIPVTAQVLEQLRHVMGTVPPSDSQLVDLFKNKGNADPLLIASALVGKQSAEDWLFPEDWLIVTDDKAVTRKAIEFGVHVLSSEEFLAELDS
jgi:hypothetical protein